MVITNTSKNSFVFCILNTVILLDYFHKQIDYIILNINISNIF